MANTLDTKTWKLKDILMMAIASVIFGFIYLGFVYVGAGITAALTPSGWGPFGYTPVYGIYFMAATFVAYIVRKPGIGIVAELIAAIVEVLLGNFFGPGVIISGLLQGAACEVPFLLTRYKRWNLGTMTVSAICVAVVSFIYDMLHDSYFLYGTKMCVVMFVVRIISSIIFTGIIAKLMADGLNKAGVLRSFAIGGKSKDLYEE